jgi:hypothetical protein
MPDRARRRGPRRAALVALALAGAVGVGSGSWAALHAGSPDAGAEGPPDASDGPEQVTCWDGDLADDLAGCGRPEGRQGLATVFPALDAGCVTGPLVPGKAEAFVCDYPGFLVRYSRWQEDVDRVAYHDRANSEGLRSPWMVAGERVGLEWASYEPGTDPQPWQWSATYTSLPYSVSVEGETRAARAEGLRMLELRPPDQVGLAPEDR